MSCNINPLTLWTDHLQSFAYYYSNIFQKCSFSLVDFLKQMFFDCALLRASDCERVHRDYLIQTKQEYSWSFYVYNFIIWLCVVCCTGQLSGCTCREPHGHVCQIAGPRQLLQPHPPAGALGQVCTCSFILCRTSMAVVGLIFYIKIIQFT